MRRYVLKKDLPTFKAGQLSYISEQGNLIAGNPDKPEITDAGVQLMMYHKITLEKFPEILTEWFEEIEEPLDSIHWKPQLGDIYWCIDSDGEIIERRWTQGEINEYDYLSGNIYRELDEIEQAQERKLAEVRLRRTSTFKPDFESDGGGWAVYYDYRCETLDVCGFDYYDAGEVVRYKTREDAEKSIEKNERDWKIYLGIKEEE